MELRSKSVNRCISASKLHRNESMIGHIAAKIKEQLRSLFALNDICANKNCELMTLDRSEVKLRQTHCHRNGISAKLMLCEYACPDKMVANSEQSGGNSYVYFVNRSGDKSAATTNCNRGPTTRTNGSASNGIGSKSKIRQFFNGHSVSVLILIVFSLGFIDMVNGKSKADHVKLTN